MNIQRCGGLFYARACRKLVAAASASGLVAGGALAWYLASKFDSALVGAMALLLALALAIAAWAFYAAAIWIFKREAERSVQITEEGIRELHRGRERAFIPWAGLREIELNATLIGGASLRLKGEFSDIAISSVDLAATGPMRLAEMYSALSRIEPLLALLEELKRRAPQAQLRMNRLARRRM